MKQCIQCYREQLFLSISAKTIYQQKRLYNYVDVRDRANGYLRQNWVGISNWIRAIYLDTGANGTFLLSDVEPYMQDTVKSNVKIKVANKQTTEASVSGTLLTYVLNLAGYEGIPASTDFDIPGTVYIVPEISKELLSVDNFYR